MIEIVKCAEMDLLNYTSNFINAKLIFRDKGSPSMFFAAVEGPKRGPMDNYFLKPAAKKLKKGYSKGTSALHNSLDCQHNDSD
jgi:hypothetical protein